MSKFKKALEKAKESRLGYEPVVSRDSAKRSPNLKSVGDHAARPELKIQYSQTKIRKVDLKTLMKSKIVSHFHDNKVSDHIKTLRTQILNKLREIGGNSLLITSAKPREGKTFTSINLGVSIAQELDRSVMLVDADLKKPERDHLNFSADFFGLQDNKGLSDYLLGSADIPELLINPGIQKLTILPGGKALSNSAEMLGSPKMEVLMSDIKRRYSKDRVIIIDGPSILAGADALVLAKYVDGILLVIEERKTTSGELKKVLELLNKKPVVGTLLNKAKFGGK
jgi:non-specific protein-tyrosine kinase